METSVRVLVANRPRLFRELMVSTLSKHAGIKIVGVAENDDDIPSLVAGTRPDCLLIALDESQKRPLLCDQLLRKFPGLQIIAVAHNTTSGRSYRASLKIHSKRVATSKNALLEVMRASASVMEEQESHEKDFIPATK